MSSPVAPEIQAATRELLTLTAQQKRAVSSALQGWIRERSVVPVTDKRVWALLRLIPALVDTLEFQWHEGQLATQTSGDRFKSTVLVLSRGVSWLPGGSWELVVLDAAWGPQSP